MTVLQVTAWLAYLVVVIPAFVTAGRAVQARKPAPAARADAATAPAASATTTVAADATTTRAADAEITPAADAATVSAADAETTPAAVPVAAAAPDPAPAPVPALAGTASSAAAPREVPRWERAAAGRPWVVAGVLVAVPALAAGVTIAALPAAATSAADAVTVSRTSCAPEWSSAQPGTQTITVTNNSGLAGEINLDDAAGAVVGEIETIGPGTSAPLSATLGTGTYTFRCFMGSQPVTASQPVAISANTVSGNTVSGNTGTTVVAVKPVTLDELTPPNKLYQGYAATQLTSLTTAVSAVEADLRHGKLAQAKKDWLTAQLDWERVGASYDSFGDLGLAVDGLPDGLPDGVNDKGFTGLHRLEYGLWNGQSAAELLPVAETLAKNVATVRKNLTSDDLAGDPTQLPIRAHEIIEDALRDHLSAIDDQGAGAAYAMTYADTQVDRVVLGYLATLINQREPGLAATADSQLATLQAALVATQAHGQWQSLTAVTLVQRQRVDSAIGALLETLASVPDLLEVPPAH
jgi:high-affinity iron transporter